MPLKNIYANRVDQQDFIHNAIEALTDPPCDVRIAVAFFTEADVVRRMVSKACRVELVVRLGFPTSPTALRAAMKLPGVQVRFFTGRTFHPKLYLFGDRAALAGSANLTSAAIMRNQEVVIAVDSEDDRFFELSVLFDRYWSEAAPLTDSILKTYEAFYQQFSALENRILLLDGQVRQNLGETEPRTITLSEQAKTSQAAYIDSFRKSYQSWLHAFDVMRRVYTRYGYRKVSEDRIPLRIEIDAFVSYVRENHARGETWKQAPLRYGQDQESFIESFIPGWQENYRPHFQEQIVGTLYPRLMRTFRSREALMSANAEEIFDALTALHSFHDRLRFFDGGLPTLKAVFLASNNVEKMRSTLAYLVFGESNISRQEDIEVRMANIIFNPAYKLSDFGRSNTQELVGLINERDIPIVNARTAMVMQFFGFNVPQLRN